MSNSINDVKRSLAVDVLKGIAIISVVVLHGLGPGGSLASWSGFHISQAVPIFILVMGLNAKRSLDRVAGVTPRELYASGYVGKRVKRLIAPALIAALALLAVARVRGIAPYIGPAWLLSKFPVPFPGQFFVGVSAYLALITPLLYAAYRRSPHITTIACILLSLGFELFAGTQGFLWPDRYFIYQSNPLRFIGLFGLGFWLADGTNPLLPRNRFIWPFAAASSAFLAAYLLGWRPWFVGPEYPCSILAGGYSLLLTAAALTWLPASSPNRALHALGYLGMASYHIFLVQGIRYGQLSEAIPIDQGIWLAIGFALCLAVGGGWYALETHRAGLAVSRRV